MLKFPPRRILVAVEFTKESIFAWEAAKELAARFGASLEAVNCAGQAAAPQSGLQAAAILARAYKSRLAMLAVVMP